MRRWRAIRNKKRLPRFRIFLASRETLLARYNGQKGGKVAGVKELPENGGVDKRSFAQDFFFELMRDSQRVRAVYLTERERWIRTLEITGREEVLFELEMLLRGMDRFFNLRNLF